LIGYERVVGFSPDELEALMGRSAQSGMPIGAARETDVVRVT
jgi:hypothetical protein